MIKEPPCPECGQPWPMRHAVATHAEAVRVAVDLLEGYPADSNIALVCRALLKQEGINAGPPSAAGASTK